MGLEGIQRKCNRLIFLDSLPLTPLRNRLFSTQMWGKMWGNHLFRTTLEKTDTVQGRDSIHSP